MRVGGSGGCKVIGNDASALSSTLVSITIMNVVSTSQNSGSWLTGCVSTAREVIVQDFP